ncbi:unnamed protein product, partial [Didymodactylos carnosus]
MTLDYDLPTVIIEGDNSAKSDRSTTDPREDNDSSNDNREKTFNAKVEDYKNGLSLSMREKSMISYRYASRIINAIKSNRVKIACCFGILEHWYPIEQLISLSAVRQDLVDLKTDGMKNISMITASKLYVRGATNGVTCSCKGGCKNKQC